MSVINKMLRDLDHRQAANSPLPMDGTVALPLTAKPGPTLGAPGWVGAPAGSQRKSRAWLLVLFGLAALLVAGAIWWQTSNRQVASTTVATEKAATAPAPLTNLPGSLAAAPQAKDAPQKVPAAALVATEVAPPAKTFATTAPDGMALRMDDTLPVRRALDAIVAAPAPKPVPSTLAMAPVAPVAPTSDAARVLPVTPAERGAARSATVNAVGGAAPIAMASRPVVSSVLPEAAPRIQRQQQAGGDALAQAQNLWNSGSREAALELMQQSLATAERSAKADPGPAAVALLTPLVREMARMQLSEGRYGAVWEMLTRLEPFLGAQAADLWAIRANAAQRLGRHQDSVHAYMVALQSRPEEQRWLLGAAVSLAALGKTAAAAELAEKARAIAPISKEIVAYLRQTGVNLRD